LIVKRHNFKKFQTSFAKIFRGFISMMISDAKRASFAVSNIRNPFLLNYFKKLPKHSDEILQLSAAKPIYPAVQLPSQT
jgi:hypothetical protein